MGLKVIEKPVFKIVFGADGPIPMLDTRTIFEEDVSVYFQTHKLMEENIITEGAVGVMVSERIDSSYVEVGKEETISQKRDVRAFDISYVNPITHKTEKLHVETQTISTDITNPIDRTLAIKSTYPVYKFITSPIYVEKIDYNILDDIRKKTEIVSPKPFGGGMAIPIIKVTKLKKAKAVEVKQAEKQQAYREMIKREKIIEKKINTRIVVLKKTVKKLKNNKLLEPILRDLPRRTRAILLVRLSKKEKVDNEIVELMLMDDIKFLEELKVKLKKMGMNQFH